MAVKKWLAGWKEWKGNSVILIANYKKKVAALKFETPTRRGEFHTH